MLKPGDNGNPLLNNRTLPPQPMIFVILIATFVFIFIAAGPLIKFTGKFSYIIIEGLILLPVMVYLIHEKFRWKTVLRLKGISKETAFASLLIGSSVAVLLDEFDRLIGLIYSMPQDLIEDISQGLTINNFGDFLLLGLGVVLVTSLSEEILFRGFLQRSLEHYKGVTKAVTTTSLIFALIHFNYWWIIQIVVLSVVLGVLAWRADSILPPVIAHAVHNGLGLWSANTDFAALPIYNWKGHVSPLILLSAGILIYYSMWYFYRLTEHLHPGEGDEIVEEEEK